MATKTISIDIEAYDCLRRARRDPKESFSKVIRRARWDEDPRTAEALLERCKSLPLIDDETLGRLERSQAEDAPPADRWQNG